MDHLAIMDPRRKLLPLILNGKKTIESRWYVHKIAPWDRIKKGDFIYFKDAGKPVTLKAIVANIIQKELQTISDATSLIKDNIEKLQFSKNALIDHSWLNGKKYGILIFLEKPISLEPFLINKNGYGSACAWITIPDINALRK